MEGWCWALFIIIAPFVEGGILSIESYGGENDMPEPRSCVESIIMKPRLTTLSMLTFYFTAIPDSTVGIAAPDFPEFTPVAGSGWRQPKNVEPLCRSNTNAFNAALKAAKPGDTVLVPDGSSFHFTGGIQALDLHHVTIDIAGSMHFVHNQTVSRL